MEKLISVVVSTAIGITFVVVMLGFTGFMVMAAIVDGLLSKKIKPGGCNNGKVKRSFSWYK